ncbi:DUF3592 domain-containing protein [Luteolibacter arcticus]|uniref:DUF3592 domain-containing protein n=1 Tax=Luteolibacter arcticus TaxID=1581411 RepID=A0ABT3GSD5_9BACT|nr:DUF3592 domain-containing protein [Luteolibacter arcticus]MCW1926408.1 DUF3592 domain-containing protein [Luteolibacter arcticus]
MSLLRRLQIYLDCEARSHACLLLAFLAFCLILYFGDRIQAKRGDDAKAAATWPQVEAQVVSSQIHEVNVSTETSFSTRLHVSARFTYHLNGQPAHGHYAGQWERTDHHNWADLLKPGSRMKVRISPDDPAKVSLVDHNGVQ